MRSVIDRNMPPPVFPRMLERKKELGLIIVQYKSGGAGTILQSRTNKDIGYLIPNIIEDDWVPFHGSVTVFSE